MKLDNARFECGKLIIETKDPEARRFVYTFQPGEYEIKRAKKKRSLEANAYMWVLVDKIASAVGVDKVTVYREAIKQIPGNSEIVCVREEAVEKLIKGWGHNGIGWIAETMPSKLEGCVNVVLYYGSSTYDTAQMSRLIDHIVDEAKQLGIETLTPAELERMKSAWL